MNTPCVEGVLLFEAKPSLTHMHRHHGSPSNNNTLRAHRVIASLNREQVDFLDKIGKDALFSAGVKLSRTQVLAAMVNVLKRFHLTGEGITSPEQFERRIVEAMERERGGDPHA